MLDCLLCVLAATAVQWLSFAIFFFLLERVKGILVPARFCYY